MMSVFRSRLWHVALVVGLLAGGVLLGAGCSGDNSPTAPSTDPGFAPDKAGGPPSGTGTIVLEMNLSYPSWRVIGKGPGTRNYFGWGPDTIDSVPVGTYTVYWGDAEGFVAKPASERGRVKANQTLTFTTVYYIDLSTQDIGDPVVADPKSKWGMDGPPKHGANRPDVK